MALAIVCPRCGIAPVEVAKKSWFIQGFLLLARYGSRVRIGCRRCVNWQVFVDFLVSFALGWWCFPWGLGTPLVLVQNLALLVMPSSAFKSTLDTVLLDVGVLPDEVELDDRGFTKEENRLFDLTLTVLAGAIWADGQARTEEYENAVGIASKLAGGRVAATEIARELEIRREWKPDFGDLSMEFRTLLFHMAADTVSADGHIAEAEASFLHRLGDQLGFDDEEIDYLLGPYRSVRGADALRRQDPEFQRACVLLGVDVTTPITEVRSRYRSLVMKAHPDVAGPDPAHQAEAHARTQELNWAYNYVLKGAAPAA